MKIFREAVPIWLKGREREKNIQAVFSGTFYRMPQEGAVTVTVTASSLYRLRINGSFAGYGPARAAHGYARVDRLVVTDLVHSGENQIEIEVAGYACASYYTLSQPSFLLAEVCAGTRVLAATGRNFRGARRAGREQKVHRYSFQRTFTEVWDLGAADVQEETVCLPRTPQLLERGTPLPDCRIIPAPECGICGVFSFDPGRELLRDRFIAEASGEIIDGFSEEEIPHKPYDTWQRMRFGFGRREKLRGCRLKAGEYLLIDLGQNRTGFLRSRVRVPNGCHYMISFDEKLTDGAVDFRGYGMVNLVDYRAPAGEWDSESFEAYGLRYACLIVTQGELELLDFGLRCYQYPIKMPVPATGDPTLDRICLAAEETFRQNTVDLYMDCPTRERAGWLCDSYFTAQAEYVFTGMNRAEQCFMENYRLYPGSRYLPTGMLPMCYPADHPDRNYIPQWAMWYILELEAFLRRTPGEKAEDYRSLCFGLLDYFANYENRDGLLERLPGWNFVEWSRANDWAMDVNYPTNMLYCTVCRIIGTIFGDAGLLGKAERIRETVLEQSFDGRFFVDHACRLADGSLAAEADISEACQYYAMRFLAADPEKAPFRELKQAIIRELGPGRKLPKNMEPANALPGFYLRMELLHEWGCHELLREEMKTFFGEMAERTGTLWENRTSCASLNHGFASFAGALLLK